LRVFGILLARQRTGIEGENLHVKHQSVAQISRGENLMHIRQHGGLKAHILIYRIVPDMHYRNCNRGKGIAPLLQDFTSAVISKESRFRVSN
jgi:hypothetical protein